MPQGYIVQLGDSSLDAGDTIVGPYTTFTADTLLGAGTWTWTGHVTDDDDESAYYVNEVETGNYYQGTDGTVYFVPDYGPVDILESATATTAPSYSDADGIIDGTATGDLINANYVDSDGDSVDNGSGGGTSGNQDTINAGAGDDTVIAGADNDTVYAGDGADSVDAGTGDDAVMGGIGNDSLSGGDGNDQLWGEAGDDALFSGDGDDFAVGGDGNDTIKGSYGQDTLVGGAGNDSLMGGDDSDLLMGGEGNDSINGGGGSDTLHGDAGADLLDGGYGDDSLTGGEGNDTLKGAQGADEVEGGAGDDWLWATQGDTLDGGSGDDNFVIDDLLESGSQSINIIGGNDVQIAGDTLHFNGNLVLGSVNITSTDPVTGLTGTALLTDGSTVAFTGIETIICFTSGTRIATPAGARLIETLQPGDLVMTRDHGPQPVRWIGQTTTPALGDLAPIRIAKGQFGATRDLLVSPQHRMLYKGSMAQCLFGESEVLVTARHMINDQTIRRQVGGMVTYFHLLMDQHEIIFAEDAPTESFFPGDQALSALDEQVRDDLFKIAPDLRTGNLGYELTARQCLSSKEASILR
ncbi:type I secretion protein [Sedimentitalea sp. CY04]|uniref:Type I secretion protein n=1 Tax=Parasedimentitalea denitrificans TaxID=2211118 RepID=A0ABX0WB39_9RHOB|nr:Hint domain-containing protein [Sedimentitalea sp. CY04]NIZ62891.1 type I secretion protein [Sedimentitalea sp. CY04]